jgi:hypothetical protein
MAEKGWLKRQLDEAEQEIEKWPEWKKAYVDDQYEELKQHTSKPKEEDNDQD